MSVATAPVSSPAAVRWAHAAVAAALGVPATGSEQSVWAVRGLAETALGCLLLRVPEALWIVDDAVRDARFGPAGAAAARLRRVRALAGPVPPFYPEESEPAVPVRAVDADVAAAAAALRRYCAALGDLPGVRHDADELWGGGPAPSAHALLARGAVLRPSAYDHAGVRTSPAFPPGTAWRTWFRLPHGPVLVERPPVAPAPARAVWRAVHDGAHLDHLAALPPAAPAVAEYGAGLLTAEAYAMAVEIVAAAEAWWTGRAGLVRELCKGIAERAGRPSGDGGFGALPSLASAYVLGPLRLLGGADRTLPGRLGPDLRTRWRRVAALVPSAAELDRRMGALC
ncbi:hypothetical protein E1200_04080 [Actinomadura sp. GC306]|uniref:hypothetical protein n=1 Tax=Actinomadura sp. GC306 TaxID=2530367 RepID=UPI0010439132|nr:hypothetical protein [Actinomadura sp. GC306]TDC70792.1 hypothetical protein E1200_04080 [Actinomadura sp. GC306]